MKTYKVLKAFEHEGVAHAVGEEFTIEVDAHKVKHLVEDGSLEEVA